MNNVAWLMQEKACTLSIFAPKSLFRHPVQHSFGSGWLDNFLEAAKINLIHLKFQFSGVILVSKGHSSCRHQLNKVGPERLFFNLYFVSWD